MSRYSPDSTKSLSALCILYCEDLHSELAFFTDTLGLTLDLIYPADDPRVAEISGLGLALRLVRGTSSTNAELVIKSSDDDLATRPRQTPAGTKLRWESVTTVVELPATQHQFEVRTLKDSAPWVIGRAGMHYRDLIPSRLGGSIIASHIRIPDGGPVPDMVHYHTVGFQLIYCVAGWVKLVYEDQGDEFYLRAGDCVTQPPEIRHRVLEASDGLEVIEIGVPAEHITTIDHSMQLPNSKIDRERLFDGQRFCHHRLDEAEFLAHRLPGFIARETGVASASGGKASVRVVSPISEQVGEQANARKFSQTNAEAEVTTPKTIRSAHDADILFSYVLAGTITVEGQQLLVGDAYTLPPHEVYQLSDFSADLSVLEVSLPGSFKTEIR